MPGVPVGAAVGDRIRDVAAVGADREIRERRRRVRGQRVRVHQHARRRRERLGPVQDALVLLAALLDEEVTPALLDRHARLVVEPGIAVLLVVPEFGQALADGLARGDRVQVGLGELVLRRHPAAEFVGRGLHPAVRIGDRGAVVDVGHRAARGRRIAQAGGRRIAVRAHARAGRERGQDKAGYDIAGHRCLHSRVDRA